MRNETPIRRSPKATVLVAAVFIAALIVTVMLAATLRDNRDEPVADSSPQPANQAGEPTALVVPDARLIAGINSDVVRRAGVNNLVVRMSDVNGGWQSPWWGLTGYFTDISVAIARDGRIAVVAVDENVTYTRFASNVFVRTADVNGNWDSGWSALDGYLTRLTAAFDTLDRLWVAGVNTNVAPDWNNVFVRWQTEAKGAWYPSWAEVPGWLSDLDLAASKQGMVMVGVNIGADPRTDNVFLQSATLNGGWRPEWTRVTGHLTTVAVTVDALERFWLAGVNATVLGADNVVVRQQTANGGFADWTLLSGTLTDIDVASAADGRIVLAGINDTLPDDASNVFVRRATTADGAATWDPTWTTVTGYLTDISLAIVP